MSGTKAVIFDLDGVLTDSEWFIAEAACMMFKETFGVNAVHDDFTPFVGAGENRYLGGVAEKYGLEQFDIERDKARTYEIYVDIVKGKLKALPGGVEFVHRCHETGLKTALATSTDYIKMKANLEAIGLFADNSDPRGGPAFDVMLNGLEVERRKPFPDIYLEAASRLGAAPEDCWVIEDAVNGVQAAKAAGMKCLGLLTSFSEDKIKAAGADRIVKDLSEIRPDDLK